MIRLIFEIRPGMSVMAGEEGEGGACSCEAVSADRRGVHVRSGGREFTSTWDRVQLFADNAVVTEDGRGKAVTR